MKKNCIIIVFAMLVASCASDNFSEERENESMPIRIGASIIDGELLATTRAQAVWFNSFPGNTKVNFYIQDEQNNKYIPETSNANTPVELISLNQGSNVLYPNIETVQFMGFAKSYENSVYTYYQYPAGCETLSIHALYPTSVTDASTSFSVNLDQTENSDYQLSDLLFADTVGAPRSAYPINLEFKHQMAKIVVNILGDQRSNLQQVALLQVDPTISITPHTCTLGDLSGTKGTIIVSSITTNNTFVPTSVSALIPPQIIGSNNFISVTTQSGKTAYFSIPGGSTFKSGKVYSFNVTINNSDFPGTTTTCYKQLNVTGGISPTISAFYNYTGVVQKFIVPEDGNYLLEVWGAQGGIAGQTASGLRSVGGTGGYTQATYTLKKNTVLYVVVGGAGGNIDDDGIPCIGGVAGYNGGGYGGDGRLGCAAGGGGGGATHIALADGILSMLSDNRDAILVVAGGGGGGSWTYDGNKNSAYPYDRGNGGYGGGATGGPGTRVTTSNASATGMTVAEVIEGVSKNVWHSEMGKAPTGSSDGGGQDYGYSFGQGQFGRQAISGGYGGEGGGGAGGGWYGGYSNGKGYYEVIRAQTREIPATPPTTPDNNLITEQDSLCRWITDSYDKLTAAQKTIVEQTKSRNISVVGSIWYKSSAGQNSDSGGGGGSGHINTTINTATVKYVSGEMKAGNQEFQSPNGDTVTGNSGNGVARITKL